MVWSADKINLQITSMPFQCAVHDFSFSLPPWHTTGGVLHKKYSSHLHSEAPSPEPLHCHGQLKDHWWLFQEQKSVFYNVNVFFVETIPTLKTDQH